MRTVVQKLKITLKSQSSNQFDLTGVVINMATGSVKLMGFPMIINLVLCEDYKQQDDSILIARKGTQSTLCQKCAQGFRKTVMIVLSSPSIMSWLDTV
jgi:hypothetical protein